MPSVKCYPAERCTASDIVWAEPCCRSRPPRWHVTVTSGLQASHCSLPKLISRQPSFLDAKQMAGVFQMLRSNDLIWSRMIQTYFMSEREPMIDLMAWNADATRLPYRVHSEYLRRLCLNNELVRAERYQTHALPDSHGHKKIDGNRNPDETCAYRG